ncbi:Hypothetical_protein [Hexamita inflata]|uniref:Hypothetical_protein n=1 Tax=Hexamita inflata TaxID=28002 RepID=A0AA86R8B3_9EUKA|nr:Hypothetical protein HINF_LOCUS33684 [Hexamita inflata]CAI9967879.1 Hypothetical protein HINF_LOCUS55524 [Hexamita inflata]
MLLKCNVYLFECTLIFIATGKQLSGITIEAQQSILINQSFIQYRMTCSNSSGIVNLVNQQINLIIFDCKLTGSNLVDSDYNGYVASIIQLPLISLNITGFFVCVANISALGNQSLSLQLNAILQCDICGELNVVYGICAETLVQGQLVNNYLLLCIHPFILYNNQCICDQGYIFDQLKCVNILQEIHKTQDNNSRLQQRVENVENSVYELDRCVFTQLQYTQSVLEQYIASNYSIAQVNFQSISDILDNRIFNNVTLLSNNIYSNQITFEKYISQNATILDWRIYNNISSLSHIVQSNISILQQNFTAAIATLNLTINDLKINYSKREEQMQEIITSLVQQINCTNSAGQFINGYCVQNNCTIQGQKYINGVCQCVNINAVVQNNVCVCPENSKEVNGVCTCIISGQTMQFGLCVCPSGQPVVNNQCQVVVIINGTDNTFQCGQEISVTTFNIQTSTNQLTTSLSFSQYQIFAVTKIIQDAFIDISDNVYSTINPLFQNQKDFINIKIQLATQTMTSGSILVPNTTTTLNINKMSVVSKFGSAITVSSYINILVYTLSNTNISTLLVNLNFSMSSGSIVLINTVSGVINITGYQVLGTYQSTNIVAMIAKTIFAIGNIIQVSFKPTVYNVGNCSSYFFGTAASAEFTVSNVAIVIGNNSNQQVLTSSSSGSYYWQFGGIVANILQTSKITISNGITDCYQQINTDITEFSGFIIGHGQNATSYVCKYITQLSEYSNCNQCVYFVLLWNTVRTLKRRKQCLNLKRKYC